MLQDVEYRWNSTYDMLKVCIDYKIVIPSFYNNKQSTQLLESDWDIAVLMEIFLNVFSHATKVLSVSYYPTTCRVLSCLVRISTTLRKYRNNFPEIVGPMDEKLKKYFSDIPPIFFRFGYRP